MSSQVGSVTRPHQGQDLGLLLNTSSKLAAHSQVRKAFCFKTQMYSLETSRKPKESSVHNDGLADALIPLETSDDPCDDDESKEGGVEMVGEKDSSNKPSTPPPPLRRQGTILAFWAMDRATVMAMGVMACSAFV